MDQQEKQTRIQKNLELKNITWQEAGIPTLTQQVTKPINKRKNIAFDDDLIFDFDTDVQPKNQNGHNLDCTCKKCTPKPKSKEFTVLSSIKTEEGIKPLNRKRF